MMRLAMLAACAMALGACGSSQRAAPDEARVDAAMLSQVETVPEGEEAWSFGGVEGRLVRTRHYRVFTTESDAAIRDRVPSFMERALDHYRSALGPLPAPPMRMDVFLMDNRAQWQNLTLRLLGRRGERYLQIGRGGFATGGQALLYDIGLFDTLAIAAHEGWHQYTQRTFRDPLPVYLEEGIAAFMEGHRWAETTPVFLAWANVERFDQLRRAQAEAGLLPMDELLEATPLELLEHAGDGALNYYAQAWVFVHFLYEGAGGKYRDGLRRMLIDASQGNMRTVLATRMGRGEAMAALASRRGSAVIEAYFTEDLVGMSREYGEFLDRVVRPGSRGAIVEGRSPVGGP